MSLQKTLIGITLSEYLKLNGSLEYLNEQIRLLNVEVRYKCFMPNLNKTRLLDINKIRDSYKHPEFENHVLREILLDDGQIIKAPFEDNIIIFLPLELPKEFLIAESTE